jgi:diaminohydroxyphosphoribosylaminopyrimidine deaminase / 5-amino-6-(5-phosphoribosylamino)uracil reductase
MSATTETYWMRMALRLAARGQGRTSPNPMVGAVVVKGGELVGTGWHRTAGKEHAETAALDQASDKAAGATLYVNLEPCSHHGRTPPCTDALIKAGVTKVVASSLDPDRKVSGSGKAALEAAGIEVEIGVMEKEARQLNQAYFVHRIHHRPFVTYKCALSLDGRTAAADGSSQWITGPDARQDVQKLRATEDAICAGVGTVLADNPRLTVRPRKPKSHRLRVVVDSQARTPLNSNVLSSEAPTVVVTALSIHDPRAVALAEAGVQVLSAPGPDGQVSLPTMLEWLADQGVLSLLLEGGATLAAAFLEQGLIDKYVMYLAPKLIGGGGPGMFEGWTAPSIGDAATMRVEEVRKIGSDIRVVAYPAGSSSAVA